MAYFKIERPSDGMVVVIEAGSSEEAVRKFEEQYDSELYVDETTAAEYAEFKRDEAADTQWYS